jgi:hypothetical protein
VGTVGTGTGSVVIALSFIPYSLWMDHIFIEDYYNYKIGGWKKKHEVKTPLSLCQARDRQHPDVILDLITLF